MMMPLAPAPSYLHSTVPVLAAIPAGYVGYPASVLSGLPWATQLTCSLTFKRHWLTFLRVYMILFAALSAQVIMAR